MGDKTKKAGKAQFFEEVFPAELEEIARRRMELDLSLPPRDRGPSTELGLVGLALSGGGIRSATFSLGVIQALAQHGLLKSVDYLSTVSGGGYIGGCVSSVLNAKKARPQGARFPLHDTVGAEESEALTHLRNSSKYLVTGGILEKLRLPTLFLRGILINLFLFLPFVVLAVFVTELVYEVTAYHFGRTATEVFQYAPVVALIVFIFLSLTYPLITRFLQATLRWAGRNFYELLLTAMLAFAVLLFTLIPVFFVIEFAIEHSPEELQEWLRQPFTDRSYPILLAFGAVLLVFMLAGKASASISKLSGKFILYLLGALGPSVLIAVYLAFCVFQLDSPNINPELEADLKRGEVTERLREAFSTKRVNLSPAATIETVVDGREWQIIDDQDQYRIKKDHGALLVHWRDLFWDGRAEWIFYGVFFFFLLFNRTFVDVNITSGHEFYRDRLSRAYLFQVDEDGDIIPNDDQKLSELGQDGTAAPYHLINVALNLQGSMDRSLRGRNADFFSLSKRYVGSERTGFCPTERMESVDTHLNLGTAMAISGAAAAPNMGSTTIKSLTFIMTLLNVRLGYWLPHPSAVRKASGFGRALLLLRPGPMHLLKEALGRLDAKGRYINISDGGHVENLAIYELLRRRCQFIIAVDGEADPTLSFGGLITLILYARIDMGIDIDIDLTELRKNSQNGMSGKHWTLGTITYAGNEQGRLLYIKSSLTGDENEYIREYRSAHPTFPHESTANQFFTERQFEAYRALGQHIAGEACAALASEEAATHQMAAADNV